MAIRLVVDRASWRPFNVATGLVVNRASWRAMFGGVAPPAPIPALRASRQLGLPGLNRLG